MAGVYNITSKQVIIAPFFQLYSNLESHLESTFAVRAAFLCSFEGVGG